MTGSTLVVGVSADLGPVRRRIGLARFLIRARVPGLAMRLINGSVVPIRVNGRVQARMTLRAWLDDDANLFVEAGPLRRRSR